MRKNLYCILPVIALVAVSVGTSCESKEQKEAKAAAAAAAAAEAAAKQAYDNALTALKGTDAAAIIDAAKTLGQEALQKMTVTNPFQPSDFSYDLNKAGDGIVIREYTGKSGVVIIPKNIEGYPVVEIGERAFAELDGIGWDGTDFYKNPNETVILLVVLPETITKIGKSAFYLCRKLAYINLPAGLKYIGGGAFEETALTDVTIPEGVVSINPSTFYHCSSLVSLGLPSTIKEIGTAAFFHCTELADVIIPDTITKIKFIRFESYPLDNFHGCGKLKLAFRQRLKDLGYTGDF